MSESWPKVKLGEVIHRSDETIETTAENEYREITVKLWGKGVVQRGVASGMGMSSGRRFVAHDGQFIISRIDARNGAAGIVPPELDGAVVTNDFPLFKLDRRRLEPNFLGWLSKTSDFVDLCKRASEGTTNRVRLQEIRFLDQKVALPTLEEQRRIVARVEELASKVFEAKRLRAEAEEEGEALLVSNLGKIYRECASKSGKRTISSFAEVKGGKRLPAGERLSDVKTNFPYIRVSDMENHTVSLKDLKFVPERLQPKIARYIIRSADVYVTIAGTIGYPGTIPEELDGANLTENASRLVFFDSSSVDKQFVVFMLRSPQVQELFHQKQTVGAQPKLALHRIASTEIPLPELAEQRRISKSLAQFQEGISRLKEIQTETAVEIGALLPAILDRAFRGEL